MTETSLLPLVQRYFEDDPLKAAHILESLSEDEAVEIIKSLPSDMAMHVVTHLADAFAANLMQRLPYPAFRAIVEKMDPQQGAQIFLHFPDHVRQLFLWQLPEKQKAKIQEILTYPEDSAGRLMSTDFMAFHGDMKVQAVIEKVRQAAKEGNQTSYTYVIDRDNCLIGVINMRDLIVASPSDVLETVMRKNVFAVDCFLDSEKLAAEISARHYFALPVVDHENRLLGVVKAESLLGEVQEEATEDVQKMFGAGGNERAFSTIGFSLLKRLPWLHVNLATAFMAAAVVAFFEDIIAKITILAVFLPVVAGQGGNAGAQSLAVVMRGLVMREIPEAKVRKLILKEAIIGLSNGIILGIVTGLIAWFWQDNAYLGFVVGLGMMVNLIIAGFSGAAIPLTMKAIGLDPAQCSNIILTTVTDVMGFLAFLGFAVLFQAYLI